MWIVFEGPEATGKSTQTQLLKESLEETGREVVLTKEPGSPHDQVCTQIRQLLLSTDNQVCEKTSLFLFLADRAQHMENVILPALAAGKIVISDRSSLSTLFYYLASVPFNSDRRLHAWMETEPFKALFEMLAFAQHYRKAELCFIAGADYTWAKQAMIDRGGLDRIEQKGDRFHETVHLYFKDCVTLTELLSRRFCPQTIYTLPSIPKSSTEEIADFALQKVLSHLN